MFLRRTTERGACPYPIAPKTHQAPHSTSLFWACRLYKQSTLERAIRVKLTFRHKVKKRQFTADTRAMRYARMLRRIEQWASVAPETKIPGFRSSLLMVTLTFAPPVTYEPGLIREFMERVRTYLKKDLIGYAWVCELQVRGEVHYHVLLKVKGMRTIPAPDQQGWWPWGDSNVIRAEYHTYILKYAQKSAWQDDGEWRDYPKGARLFAVWLNEELYTPVVYWRFRLSVLPGWLRETLLESFALLCADWSHNPGGGWRIDPKWVNPHHYTYVLFSPWVVSLDSNQELGYA